MISDRFHPIFSINDSTQIMRPGYINVYQFFSAIHFYHPNNCAIIFPTWVSGRLDKTTLSKQEIIKLQTCGTLRWNGKTVRL